MRSSISKALALEPKTMLFGEVTSGLDPRLVTHGMGFAHKVADEVVFMDAGAVWTRSRPARSSAARARTFIEKGLTHD